MDMKLLRIEGSKWIGGSRDEDKASPEPFSLSLMRKGKALGPGMATTLFLLCRYQFLDGVGGGVVGKGQTCSTVNTSAVPSQGI